MSLISQAALMLQYSTNSRTLPCTYKNQCVKYGEIALLTIDRSALAQCLRRAIFPAQQCFMYTASGHSDGLLSIHLMVLKKLLCIFVSILFQSHLSDLKQNSEISTMSVLDMSNHAGPKTTIKLHVIRCLFFTQQHVPVKWMKKHEYFTHHWALVQKAHISSLSSASGSFMPFRISAD